VGFSELTINQSIGKIKNWRLAPPVMTPPPAPSIPSALLLHLDADFTDSSPNNFTLTNTGVTISTATKQWGDGSGSFNGSSFLTLPTNSVFNRGTGDWCLEIWINADTGSGSVQRNIFTSPGFSANGLSMSSSRRLIWWEDGVGNKITGTPPQLTESTFNYIAVSKSANTITVWVNNASYTTFSDASSYNFSGWLIGSNQFNPKWLGFIDEFRLTAENRTINAIPTGPFPNS